MLLKKISLILLSIICTILLVYVDLLFIVALLIILHLLFNETDFLYWEKSFYILPKAEDYFTPEAGPWEIDNRRDKAIIFVHGFPSCPATFKYVLPMAEKAGYDVFAPLLPGFGTKGEDFIKSNFSQWFAYLSDFYLEKRKSYKNIYVVGLSMGGSLTLKLAESYSNTPYAPNGIATSSAPVFLNDIPLKVNKSTLLYFIRSISWFINFLDNKNESWKEMEDGHGEWLGYRGSYPKQIYSLKMALEKIRNNLKKITVPIISFHVKSDTTVNFKNLSVIEKNISSEVKSFNEISYEGWNNTSHCLFLYESIREQLFKDIDSFFCQIEE